MKKIANIALLLIFLFSGIVKADVIDWGIGGEDGGTLNDYKKNTATDVYQYGGDYHFGESEWEYTMRVIITPAKKIYVQVYTGHFNEKGTKWIREVENYKNVKISGNKITGESLNGEFVIFAPYNMKGILITDTEKNKKNYSFGEYTGKANIEGKYPEISLKEMSSAELAKKSREELKIMRNEVYARYGMIFTKNGDMDKYFSKQEWYTPNTADVDKFLTQLEKDNIKLILEAEKQN